MKRRQFLVATGALGVASVLAACQAPAGPLRIASYLWPGYEFLFLARREGWIPATDVELLETASATESLALLADGRVDGSALTLDEMLGARQRGLPLVAVLVFDISMGADTLLARPPLGALGELRGRRVGFEASAVGALMVYQALAAAGLGPGDVVPVPVAVDRHLAAWEAGEVDALVTFEPISSRLEGLGARRLFDSSQIPNTIIDVLAVTPEAVERKADALEKLVAAHFRGLRRFRKNPNDVAHRMADRFKLPPRRVIGAYRGLELPNELRNRELLEGPEGLVASTARSLVPVLVRAGILPDVPTDLGGLASAAFIPREPVPWQPR